MSPELSPVDGLSDKALTNRRRASASSRGIFVFVAIANSVVMAESAAAVFPACHYNLASLVQQCTFRHNDTARTRLGKRGS